LTVITGPRSSSRGADPDKGSVAAAARSASERL